MLPAEAGDLLRMLDLANIVRRGAEQYRLVITVEQWPALADATEELHGHVVNHGEVRDQPRRRINDAQHGFAAVGLKELVDNAIDACEAAGVAPQIAIFINPVEDLLLLSVKDNGAGIAPETVRRALNFTTRTSDKRGYRAPTRGMQGNALKTIFGMPAALGLPEAPIMINAHGVQHVVRAWLDPAGGVRIEHDERAAPPEPGTTITLTIPTERQRLAPRFWARAFALFNPHAAIRILIPKEVREQATSIRAISWILTNRLSLFQKTGESSCQPT